MPFVKLLVEPKDPSKVVPREDESGKVDFYNIEPVENVLIGQVLAVEVEEKEEGGRFLEGSLKDFVGENTGLSEDGKSLVSLVNGYVTLEGGKICVKETWEVENVDFRTGNVTFVGTLVVKDSIRKGFSVIAGRIIVYGNIEDAHVKATGNIMVKGGIIGARSHGVESFSSVEAGYIQESKVVAKGNIYVKKGILNSLVLSGGSVLVEGDIVGSTVKAKDMIVARNIGQHTEYSSPSEIHLGKDPVVEKTLEEVKEKLKTLEKGIEEKEKICRYLSSKPSLKAREEIELIKSKKELDELKKSLARREKELKKLLEDVKKVNAKAYLRVNGAIEEKTQVFLIDKGMEFQKDKRNVKVFLEGGKVKVEEIGGEGGEKV